MSFRRNIAVTKSISRVINIARANWVYVLECITVVSECDVRTSAKTVMASDECAMYS